MCSTRTVKGFGKRVPTGADAPYLMVRRPLSAPLKSFDRRNEQNETRRNIAAERFGLSNA